MHHGIRAAIVAASVVAIHGCGDGGRDDAGADGSASEDDGVGPDASGDASVGDSGSVSLSASSSVDDSGDDALDGSDDGPKFDVGDGDTDGDTEGRECTCGSQLEFSYIWVANSSESTISKINTVTMVEEGRYLSRSDSNGNPSRSSVSLSGRTAAVANRNGGVIAIHATPELCDPMTNGVPDLQTSTGAADVLPWGQDDCIKWYADFAYTTQRPIAWLPGELDPATCTYENERLWTSGCATGTHANIQVHRLDGDTGTVLDTVEVAGFACSYFGGYGGAVDPQGNFWISELGTTLARVDGQTLQTQVWQMPNAAYGITVDHLGRPWTANNSSGTGSATRFDPMTEMFQTAPVGLEAGQSGIQEDAFGRMWVHDGYSAGVGWMDVDTMEIGGMIPYGQVANGICKGISIDLNGNVWSVCSTEAFRIDPDTQQVDVYSGLNYAYTYSDMTGWALQNASCDPRG